MRDCLNQRVSRYSAFISYSHADTLFARRLHRALEAYRLPRRVCRPLGALGSRPRQLKPVFRDREELSAAPDLTAAVRQAISEADYLIVVCSAHSATSSWVRRETALFRDVHGEGRILAALVEGGTDKCLHAILHRPDGEHIVEPLAADYRRDGDGSRLALLKLVAALAGVRLDELVQRDAQRRVRQLTTISVAALLGMSSMTLLATAAINARDAAERERGRGETLIDYMLTDLRSRLKAVGRLDVLNVVNQGALRYYMGQNLTTLPATALQQRAKLLQALGEDDEKRGNTVAARSQFEEAKRTTAALLRAKPDDPQRVFAHAQSEYWVGFSCWRNGDNDCAGAGFRAYAALAKRLTLIDPSNSNWLLEAGYGDSNLATFVLRRFADTAQAEPLFAAALANFKAAADRRPNDRDIRESIADAYAWLADVERIKVNYLNATKYRSLQLEILQSLLRDDPRDYEVRKELASNTLGLARISLAEGEFLRAGRLLKQGEDVAMILHNEDPDNDDVTKQTRIFELFEVETWLKMPLDKRPPANIVSARLGSCEQKSLPPVDDELILFCRALQTRFFAANGKLAQGRAMAVPLLLSNTARNRLTERWLLDMTEETGIPRHE